MKKTSIKQKFPKGIKKGNPPPPASSKKVKKGIY
jgi:hypothetical protein